MSKRKYVHMQELADQILVMREAGITKREIAEALGLEKEQVKNWITRYNRRQGGLQQGIPSKPKERPRKAPLSSTEAYGREIARLQMGNKLLRVFLQSTERM